MGYFHAQAKKKKMVRAGIKIPKLKSDTNAHTLRARLHWRCKRKHRLKRKDIHTGYASEACDAKKNGAQA